MKRTSRAAIAILLLSLTASLPSYAGPYTDSLSKCLVKATTSTDKSALVQWIFSAISLNPNVAWMANIPAQKRDEINKETARLFENLLTVSCLTETQEAVKYEGSSAVEGAFNVLGQVASREMFADPAVAKGTAELSKYIDGDRMKKLLGTEN